MNNGKGMQVYLTIEELLERWRNRVVRGTLSNWRHQGRGPSYVKFGKEVMYPLVEVQAFEHKNRIQPGSQSASVRKIPALRKQNRKAAAG